MVRRILRGCEWVNKDSEKRWRRNDYGQEKIELRERE